ncbi:hypothetical protein CB1_000614002 [Camelus ferus]|nr:hypothetical protein CB1_000614002 [Camelus ferus]
MHPGHLPWAVLAILVLKDAYEGQGKRGEKDAPCSSHTTCFCPRTPSPGPYCCALLEDHPFLCADSHEHLRSLALVVLNQKALPWFLQWTYKLLEGMSLPSTTPRAQRLSVTSGWLLNTSLHHLSLVPLRSAALPSASPCGFNSQVPGPSQPRLRCLIPLLKTSDVGCKAPTWFVRKDQPREPRPPARIPLPGSGHSQFRGQPWRSSSSPLTKGCQTLGHTSDHDYGNHSAAPLARKSLSAQLGADGLHQPVPRRGRCSL